MVFVVDDNMTEQDALFIAGYVAGSKEIDELFFPPAGIDENYKENLSPPRSADGVPQKALVVHYTVRL